MPIKTLYVYEKVKWYNLKHKTPMNMRNVAKHFYGYELAHSVIAQIRKKVQNII